MAKLFEEIKVMFRDLPEKVEGRVQETIGRRRHKSRRMFHPMMFEEMMFHPAVRESPDGEAATWLMLGSSSEQAIAKGKRRSGKGDESA